MEYLTIATLTVAVLVSILTLGHLYWHRSTMTYTKRRS